jgi:hypothetical protein
MKLLRLGEPGAEVPAALLPDGSLVALADVVPDISADVLARDLPRIADHLAQPQSHELIPADGLRVGPPVTRPGKIVCVGLNYRDHAEESGMEFPPEPVLFMKASQCVVGPYDDVPDPSCQPQDGLGDRARRRHRLGEPLPRRRQRGDGSRRGLLHLPRRERA